MRSKNNTFFPAVGLYGWVHSKLAKWVKSTLALTAVALLGKVTLRGKSRFGATGQTTHINIEHLEAGLIVMLKALTVLAIDAVERLFHLLHILGGTGIQGVLHHRLLGTATAPEGALQGAIRSQARIDLHQAMGSWKPADKGVVEFVARAILDRLLCNLHTLLNRLKHLQFSQLDANGGQSSAASKLFDHRCGRFVHDDAPSIAKFSLYDR